MGGDSRCRHTGVFLGTHQSHIGVKLLLGSCVTRFLRANVSILASNALHALHALRTLRTHWSLFALYALWTLCAGIAGIAFLALRTLFTLNALNALRTLCAGVAFLALRTHRTLFALNALRTLRTLQFADTDPIRCQLAPNENLAVFGGHLIGVFVARGVSKLQLTEGGVNVLYDKASAVGTVGALLTLRTHGTLCAGCALWACGTGVALLALRTPYTLYALCALRTHRAGIALCALLALRTLHALYALDALLAGSACNALRTLHTLRPLWSANADGLGSDSGILNGEAHYAVSVNAGNDDGAEIAALTLNALFSRVALVTLIALIAFQRSNNSLRAIILNSTIHESHTASLRKLPANRVEN